MATPPLNIPRTVTFSDIPTGTSVSSMGGGRFHISGEVTARIDGDADSVFSLVRLETYVLIHDPDAPPSAGRAWEVADAVDGSGPIGVGPNQPFSATVTFWVPEVPSQATYTAQISILQSGTSGPVLAHIPIQATVNFAGNVQIVTTPCPLLMNGILPGNTDDLVVLLESTLPDDATGTFSMEPGDPAFSAQPVEVFLPARSTVTVTLPVTCAPGTTPGYRLDPTFAFDCSNSAGSSSIVLRLLVLDKRTVTVTTDLGERPSLAPGSSTVCKVTALDSGGLSMISFTPGPLPAGVSLSLGTPQIIGTGGPLPTSSRTIEMDMAIVIGVAVAPGDLPPFVLNWDVPADGSDADISGTVAFEVTVTVPPPSGGLVANTNYFLVDGGNALQTVSTAIRFDADMISTANGWSIQLNGWSLTGNTTGWQQYVVWADVNSASIMTRIDNWLTKPGTDGKLVQLINVPDSLATLSNATVPKGSTITIALDNDASGNISGVTFEMTDNNGLSLGTVTKTIVGLPLLTTSNAATTANLAPLGAIQLNIVGDYNYHNATFSSGSGTITYSASKVLTVTNKVPSYIANTATITGETSNMGYGVMPATDDVVQTFQASEAAKKAAIAKLRHPLPGVIPNRLPPPRLEQARPTRTSD